ncbi:uncharacterized protein LOC131146590 [Malania oleifera]|uniref:uncharacterized protein LOC131146590 n=1 Tax=Malania oleifera TaxID=397392 RepID=UPI0025AEB981|nr:uncharacterized protein LOC131146590 [Malania oleifera]
MRMPFKGGIGGGSGNRGMLRSVGRGVRAGVGSVQDPFSTSTATATATAASRPTHQKPTSANHRPLSSTSSFSSSNLPIPATSFAPGRPSPLSRSDEWDWECVDAIEDERASGYFDDYVFGSLPSKDEVETALSALRQVLEPSCAGFNNKLTNTSDKDVADQKTVPTSLMHVASSIGSDSDSNEPSWQLYNSTMFQTHGSSRVYDAFHLLQTEPSVQRMVISLSSDKAVWDAVLSNEVVKEVRESCYAAENNSLKSPDESSSASSPARSILGLFFDSTKAKVTDLIEKITKLVNQLFQSPDAEKATGGAAPNTFGERLKSSFLISVVVLLIVVATRARRA